MITDAKYVAERDRRVALLDKLMVDTRVDALVLTSTAQQAYQIATKMFHFTIYISSNSLRNLRKRNRQANWEKPSNVISAALKTSRKNSMQQQSDCSVQDGPGCQ